MTITIEDDRTLRQAVIGIARATTALGINVNTAGNVSVRCQRGRRHGMLITPTALAYDNLQPDDLVFVDHTGASIGSRKASSEWRFHHDIYGRRPEFNAIVHTHSPHAAALACQKLDIPAFHYMVAVAGGANIRCADYATFGTQALSDHALVALEDRRACLLEHHGVIACGAGLDQALALALEVEHLARIYLAVRTLGQPRLLPDDEMKRVLDQFRTYGQAGSGARSAGH
jgi:L-fuculose-phosphate aldolase